MSQSLNIDVEALRAHRADRTKIIVAGAERHRMIKSVVIMNDRIDAVLDQLEALLASSGGSAEQTCLHLIAPTRAGKTTAIRLFTELHRPDIARGGPRTSPVLFVQVPAKTGVLDIAAAILTALGDVAPTQGTLGDRMGRIRRFVASKGVRLIILDELQHLVSRENEAVNHQSADWIKSLVNELGVAFALCGTERVERIFAVNDQLPGRMADPTFRLAPWDLHDADDFEFASQYYANWDDLLMRVGGFRSASGLSDEDMVARLILASQGWPGLGAKLIHFASKIAIDDNRPSVGLAHFSKVFQGLRMFMLRAGSDPFVAGSPPTAKEIWLPGDDMATTLERAQHSANPPKGNKKSRGSKAPV